MGKKTRENRWFRRYRKHISAKVSVDGREMQAAEVLDYSLSGLGIIMKKPVRIVRGDMVAIESDELAIREDCEVEWVSRTTSGLQLGLRRTAPMRGSLQDFRLADIIIGLQRSMKTGTLKIASGPVEKSIFIKNGDIIFAKSNQQQERLGEVLLREGRITRTAYDMTSKLMALTGKKQGTLLIEIDAMKPQDLSWAVQHQVEEILLGLFTMSHGSFEFLDGSPFPGKIIQLKLPGGHIIYKGLKRPGAIEQLSDFIDLPGKTIIAFSGNPLNLFQAIPFEEEDKVIMSFVDGRRSIDEISALCGFGELKVRTLLAVLLNIAVIDAVQEESTEGAHPFEFVVSDPEPPAGLIEKISEMHRKLPKLDHYAVLGLNEAATETDIRTAFYSAAKEFHPDRHFYFDRDITGKLMKIFSHITKAYNVLSSPEKRSAYDRVLSGSSPNNARPRMAEEKFIEGYHYYEDSKTEQAERCFEEAICLDSTVAKYHFFYGLALKDLNRLRDAERALSKSCKIVPQNDECHTELGLIYIRLGLPMRAKMSFIKALQYNRANVRAKEGLQSLP